MHIHIASPDPNAEEDEALAMTLQQCARRTGLGLTTIRKLIREGRLETVKVFNRRLVTMRSAKKVIFPG
jgi:excisionase family DNA binding protein